MSVLGFNTLAVGHLALVHPQAETAFRIGADPSLENHRSAFLPVIRKWYQCPIVALLALRQLHRPRPPSRRPPGPAHQHYTMLFFKATNARLWCDAVEF